MVKIITVHGTFAGDENKANDGAKWWQRGSPFLTELQSFLAERLTIEPFHWSGRNSELDRRKFAKRLEKTIRASSEPPIVIGHSHGASISVLAFARAALRNTGDAAKRVRGFAAIGMPFIYFGVIAIRLRG